MIALAIAGVFIVLGVIMWQNSDKFVDYDSTLALSAKAVNLMCPRMVDDDTRLDSVTTEPGRNYIYYYTAINIDRETLDLEKACEIMRETILENMKGDISMADFGKNNVIITFNFNDKNAVELCSIRVMPEDWYRKAKKSVPDSLTNPAP
jgi:hypothetical protein